MLRSRTIQDPDRRVGDRIFGLKEKDFGDLSVKTLKQDGKKVEFKELETVLIVKLNTVLLPGEKTELKNVFYRPGSFTNKAFWKTKQRGGSFDHDAMVS